MTAPDPAPTTLLRRGLLEGRTVALAGGGAHVAAACAELGAATPALEADLLDEEAVAAAAAALGAVDVLVCDAAAPFAAAGGGIAGLRAGADGAFIATRAVARAAWIDKRPGKVVLIAPPTGVGAHAGALRAALENTARTLSVEWARYAITTTAILPGDATSDDEVAQLVAFLASPAGDYYSGCAFTLGSVQE
jgi:NAD(P)-dependent dehydrogenase (short-subunit alcohol dehydrogenase family)